MGFLFEKFLGGFGKLLDFLAGFLAVSFWYFGSLFGEMFGRFWKVFGRKKQFQTMNNKLWKPITTIPIDKSI